MAYFRASSSLSATEVDDCIRRSGCLFRRLAAGEHIPREIMSRYDSDGPGSGTLKGFALTPPTICDKDNNRSFSSRVYSEWVKGDTPLSSGVALPMVTYVESMGAFRLNSLGPSFHPGGYFLDEARLQRILDSLAAIAVREAVKQHLTEGGDERLHIDPKTGGNQYFCPPHPVERTVIRGSCTCSPPSRPAFEAAADLLSRLWNKKVTFEDAYADIRARISAALALQTPHHVILHPSGTDSEFTPLLIGASKARALDCSGIVNVIVGAGEVGSKTPKAAGGQHFAKYTPSGRMEATSELVEDFPEGTKVIELKARGQDGRMVPEYDQLVLDAVENADKAQDKAFFIVHAVDGSKLGSHITSRELVTSLQNRYGDRVLVVLDACQLRTEREEIDWYLSHNAVVLITASKFYGSPGFCAAALVPESAAEQLVDDVDVPEGLGDYLTRDQVPRSLTALREGLPAGPPNVGLLLRWMCGVTGMERVAQQGRKAREAIRAWVHGAQELVQQRSKHLERPCFAGTSHCEQKSQLGGVNSIISFKLRTENGSLGMASLRKIHQWLTKDISTMLPASASAAERKVATVKAFIGQPVDMGDFAILRLAIGASLACELGDDMTRLNTILQDDANVLDKIVVCIKYHDSMCT